MTPDDRLKQAADRIEKASADIRFQIEQFQLLLDAVRSGAALSAQLAASALANVHISAGLSVAGQSALKPPEDPMPADAGREAPKPGAGSGGAAAVAESADAASRYADDAFDAATRQLNALQELSPPDAPDIVSLALPDAPTMDAVAAKSAEWQGYAQRVAAEKASSASLRSGFRPIDPATLRRETILLAQVGRGHRQVLLAVDRVTCSQTEIPAPPSCAPARSHILFGLAWSALCAGCRASTLGQAITRLRIRWYRLRKSLRPSAPASSSPRA